MKTFSIKDIECITGIKAHTIRIWEQRYDLVKPKRTETNIRYYDNNDIKQFINISTLIGVGLKISEVAKMSEFERQAYIKKMSGCKDGICSCSEGVICDAMFKFNSDAFNRSLDSCVQENGFKYTMLNIIIPFFKKVVAMWQSDTIILANVEFVKHLIIKRIAVAIEQLPMVMKSPYRCLLFMLEGDKNEIGLLFTEYILKRRGFQTLYIGSSLPSENVKQLVSFYQPDNVFVASMFELESYDRNAVLNSLLNILHQDRLIFVSSSCMQLDEEVQKKVKVFIDFDQMIDFIDKKGTN